MLLHLCSNLLRCQNSPMLYQEAYQSREVTGHPGFAGIMSLQLHPQHSKLLAVGCYDGSVAVYDVKAEPGSRSLFASKPAAGKHSRPVWAVEWQAAQPAMPPSFHSLSSDGKVLLWTLATAELTRQVPW